MHIFEQTHLQYPMNTTRQENCQVLEFPLPSGKTARYNKESESVFFYKDFLSAHTPAANLTVSDIKWCKMLINPSNENERIISHIFSDSELLEGLREYTTRSGHDMFNYVISLTNADLIQFTYSTKEPGKSSYLISK